MQNLGAAPFPRNKKPPLHRGNEGKQYPLTSRLPGLIAQDFAPVAGPNHFKDMENNVFQQISAWRKRRSEQATPAEIQKVATMRNDKTFADEAAWIVRLLLYLSAAFCAWASYFYYRDYLSESFSPAFVAVFSVALPLVVELLKIKITHNVLRSIFFGWMFKSGWTLGYWFFLLVLAAGSYWWSVSISTDGMQKYSAMKADQTLESDSLRQVLSLATSDIDAQIASAQRNYDSAVNTKWKGTTTYQAQKAAVSQSKSLENLQAQRSEIIAAVTQEYQEGRAKRTGKIDAWAAFVRKFGGYMELASAICLVALVFFERRLFALYNSQIPAPPTPSGKKPNPDTGTQYTYTPGQPYTVNGHGPAQNHGGFSIRPLSTLFEHRKHTVPRSEKTVARSSPDTVTTDADTVLKYAKSRLQSNVANFSDRQRRKATTAANCTAIVNDVAHKFRGRGFEPSPEVASDFYQYIQTVFDAMDANGYPYEYERAFLDDLLQFVPALDTPKAA